MRIYVAGHQGMVGSALVRQLQTQHYADEIVIRTRAELDLTQQADVNAFFLQERIDQVYLAAAKVGGIWANSTYPADFIYQNLIIECNVIQAAHQANIEKLLFLGSSCIYPRHAPQPICENALLTSSLEPTNESYAIAKIAGIKLCEGYNRQHGRDYRSVMPTNLYGPHDNFHPDNSHVIPALMRRFYDAVQSNAKEVLIWGSGTPKREFLHVDDMAAACVHVMNIDKQTYSAITQPMLSHINVGAGIDCSIAELAEILANVTGFTGQLTFDTSKPDGTPRKLLDISRLTALGWQAHIGLAEGLKETYAWFLENQLDYKQA
ncbi:GDP-L-fucose synthase [Methylocucumis oryzae]|uniref:GDP-L-fucose synthase n=1 Tax=Methylocucumis oryzae TaxID=1632867 RepID=A0A0F3IJY3_9GAMM|nr:GDP-L-fucose synthase [Methylocucumis oryzae]KJV07050.1 GDP-fucose synthetase [Methylocucumis oryzae]